MSVGTPHFALLKQLSTHFAQPAITGILMKAAVPVLLDGEAGDLHRAPQHLQAIEACQCLSDVAGQRSDQIGGKLLVGLACFWILGLGLRGLVRSTISIDRKSGILLVRRGLQRAIWHLAVAQSRPTLRYRAQRPPVRRLSTPRRT